MLSIINCFPYIENHPLLAPYVDDLVRERLNDITYLEDFIAAPWSEASQVVGGAYAALLEAQATGDLVSAVAESRSLQIIALVPHEKRIEKDKDRMGWPYVKTFRYVTNTEGENPTVAFTHDTAVFLGKLMMKDRGCTAADIRYRQRVTAGIFKNGACLTPR